MNKKTIHLVLGSHGSGKSILILKAIDQLQKDTNGHYAFVSTYVGICEAMKPFFENNMFYKTVSHSNFQSDVLTDEMMCWWRNDEEDVNPDVNKDVCETLIYYGIRKNDVMHALEYFDHVVLSISACYKAFPIIKHVFLEVANVKLIVVESPKKEVESRLRSSGIYDEEEIEKYVEKGAYISKLIEYPYTIFVDNNSTIEEGTRRFINALKTKPKQEEMDMYCKSMKDTQIYLQTQKINDILENLMSEVIIHKPEKPIKFMISTLENMKANETSVNLDL